MQNERAFGQHLLGVDKKVSGGSTPVWNEKYIFKSIVVGVS